jgi:hypothetical protein
VRPQAQAGDEGDAMITYLAAPYSHEDPDVVERRECSTAAAAAKLMLDGHVVFSPISHSHRLADYLPSEKRFDHEFWMVQDLRILESCGLLVVLCLDGWHVSNGVAREIDHARMLGIPIVYMDWN